MRFSFRHVLPLVLFLTLTLTPAKSQAGASDSTSQFSKPGQAIVFHLFGGPALYYKRCLNDCSWLRVGLDLRLSYSDGSHDRTDEYISSWSSGSETSDRQVECFGQSLDVSAIYFRDFVSAKWVAVSVGLGPVGGFGEDRSSGKEVNAPDTSEICWDDKTSSRNLGVLAIVGMEAFVTHNVSVLGEYTISAGYNWQRTTYSYGRVSPPGFSAQRSNIKSTGWSGAVNSVKIGISLYF